MIRKLGLLLLLITVLLWEAPARGEAPASTRSADFDVRPAESRGFEQEGDTLQLGEATGSLVSEVFSPGWEFMSLGVTWKNELPDEVHPVLEVRASDDGTQWGNWTPVEVGGEDRPDSAPLNFTDLLFIEGRHAQVRATLNNYTGKPVEWEGLRLVVIDSRGGPTAAELAASRAASATEPRIISRAEWGANESYRCKFGAWNGAYCSEGEKWPREYHSLKAMFVHHTYRPLPTTDPADAVRAVYVYHALQVDNGDGTYGWGDIGYNYLVDQYGNVYEGRYHPEENGLVAEAGHALGYNRGTMGVVVIGDFTNTSPPAASMNALKNLLTHRASRYGIDPQASVWLDGAGNHPNRTFTHALMAHRDSHNPARTTCPGDALYARMDEIRRDVAAGINQPPPPPLQVQLTSPPVDAVVDGLFTLQASPDSTGPSVRRVEFYLVSNGLNGTPSPSFIGASDEPPWNIVVDSHALPAGRFTLRAIARADGGASATDERIINVATWNWINPNPVPGSRRLYLPFMQTTQNPVCRPLIKNGEFRSNTDWLTLLGTSAAWYDDARSVSPPHSLRVGTSYWDNTWSYSSAWLPLTIPSDTARATLTLKYLPEAGDLSEGNSEGGDRQYIQVRDSSDPTSAPLAQVLPYGLQNATQWQPLTYDLSAYRGRSIYLYVGAFNNGTGSSTRLYVDDVQVTACRN
jgi:hypothetical protein